MTDSEDQTMGANNPRERPRMRSSAACTSCRLRRGKCVIPPGRKECEYCQKNHVECVMPGIDQRKGRISRAHMDSLIERVGALETMFLNSVVPPGSQNDQDSPEMNIESVVQRSTSVVVVDACDSSEAAEPTEAADSHKPFDHTVETNQADSYPSSQCSTSSSSPPSISASNPSADLLQRIILERGHWNYDELTRRLRHFGPTTNLHIFANHSSHSTETEIENESHKIARNPPDIVRNLDPATHAYLMNLFWEYYNSILQVVHKEAFLEGKNTGLVECYSGLLHISILAMGLRFADVGRPDIMALIIGPRRESKLHLEARRMLEQELITPGGLPTIQALLILGDLECALGRDNTGWMYVGMACRLAFDMGLDSDCSHLGLSSRDMQARHMTLWACALYDRYWALFLGRPTIIKTSDLASTQIMNRITMMKDDLDLQASSGLEMMIYLCLLELMLVAGKMTETINVQSPYLDSRQHLAMASIERELKMLYDKFPDALKWTRNNTLTAPAAFFLLHQQYYTILILLHRPFARFDLVGFDAEEELGNHSNTELLESQEELEEQTPEGGIPSISGLRSLYFLSRKTCLDNAIRVARIFQYHNARFNPSQLFITGLDHAGTAATALIAGVSCTKNPTDYTTFLKHLQFLVNSLRNMGSVYKAAERMANVLEYLLKENSWETDPYLGQQNVTKPLIPARRGSSNADREESPSKRHRMNKDSPLLENSAGSISNPWSMQGQTPGGFSIANRPMELGLDDMLTSTPGCSSQIPSSFSWIEQVDGSGVNADPICASDPFLNFVSQINHESISADAASIYDFADIEAAFRGELLRINRTPGRDSVAGIQNFDVDGDFWVISDVGGKEKPQEDALALSQPEQLHEKVGQKIPKSATDAAAALQDFWQRY